MTNDDWKVAARARIRASIAHLSNSGKFAREQWVAARLLERLGVTFSPSDLTAASEPADVAFRSARLQVKEILDGDRRRLDEYRNDLEKVESATSPTEMMTLYEPQDLDLADAVAQVERLAAELRTAYGPKERVGLDLLVYMNLLGVAVSDNGAPVAFTNNPGFRSVSMIVDGLAVVLWADEAAPDFIREAVGRVLPRPT